MRLPILLGVLGLAFVGFAGMSFFDGSRGRDALESLIADKAREHMTSDTAYLNSISVSTGDVRRVEYRFEVVDEILSSVLS